MLQRYRRQGEVNVYEPCRNGGKEDRAIRVERATRRKSHPLFSAPIASSLSLLCYAFPMTFHQFGGCYTLVGFHVSKHLFELFGAHPTAPQRRFQRVD
jgi:hypothetical protein